MIQFKIFNKNNCLELGDKLRDLYLNTFTKGLSAQHITPEEADAYLGALFAKGFAILGWDEDQVVAALIATPPSFDQERPQQLIKAYKDNDTLYIAEVLVGEQYRGQGLGKMLFQELETYLDAQIKQVLLRVWSKNEIAVGLYKNSGFQECGKIVQQKLKPVSKEVFEMEKLYMVKSYSNKL